MSDTSRAARFNAITGIPSFANSDPGNVQDTPVPAAELAKWDEAIGALELAGGKAGEAARAAFTSKTAGNRGGGR